MRFDKSCYQMCLGNDIFGNQLARTNGYKNIKHINFKLFYLISIGDSKPLVSANLQAFTYLLLLLDSAMDTALSNRRPFFIFQTLAI